MTEELNQVATPAPAETAEPAPAAPETSVTPEATIPKSRFDEVYRLRRDAERERDYWRELANKSQPKEPEVTTQPTPEQYGFDDAKYQAALTEYNKGVARSEAIAVIQAERAREQHQQRVQSFRQREADFMAKNPDYRDVVYGEAFMSVPLTTETVELIAESPDGPAIALHLAKNLELASQLASLSPVQAAKEIGRIEARLAKEAEKPKPLTNAPPPPPSIEAVEPAVEKDPAKMTDAEFAKWRKRQIAQRR